ncbi:hypothetical protein GCM10010478_58830 [Streptomyces erythrogriseus]|uniref:Transposase n=1 Tax=Streptomyces erythrogriseus TaxID=284027 RepID=A0ABP6JVD3_9ACTN
MSDRLLCRDVDDLPLAGFLQNEHGHERSGSGVHSGYDRGLIAPSAHGRQAGMPGKRKQSTGCQKGEVCCRPVGPRAGETERADADVYQLRMSVRDIGWMQASPTQRPGPFAGEQDLRCLQQTLQLLRTGPDFMAVEDDTALARFGESEGKTDPVVGERRKEPLGDTARRFNPDDIGSKVGEQPSRVCAEARAEVDDAKALERGGENSACHGHHPATAVRAAQLSKGAARTRPKPHFMSCR